MPELRFSVQQVFLTAIALQPGERQEPRQRPPIMNSRFQGSIYSSSPLIEILKYRRWRTHNHTGKFAQKERSPWMTEDFEVRYAPCHYATTSLFSWQQQCITKRIDRQLNRVFLHSR